MNIPNTTAAALASILLCAVAGCDTPADVEDAVADPRDDSFAAGGKADGALADDSVAARSVLALVNVASLETLDASTAVGLHSRAAEGIYETRVGDDGVAGTGDDVAFETLAQLDAVPFVGRSAFDKLLDYATDNDFDDALDAPGPLCAGALTDDGLARVFANAQEVSGSILGEPDLAGVTRLVGDFTVRLHRRQCDTISGCAAWEEFDTNEAPSDSRLVGGPDAGSLRIFTGHGSFGDPDEVYFAALGKNPASCQRSSEAVGQLERDGNRGHVILERQLLPACNFAGHVELAELSGVVTNTCAKFSATFPTNISHVAGETFHTEWAVSYDTRFE